MQEQSTLQTQLQAPDFLALPPTHHLPPFPSQASISALEREREQAQQAQRAVCVHLEQLLADISWGALGAAHAAGGSWREDAAAATAPHERLATLATALDASLRRLLRRFRTVCGHLGSGRGQSASLPPPEEALRSRLEAEARPVQLSQSDRQQLLLRARAHSSGGEDSPATSASGSRASAGRQQAPPAAAVAAGSRPAPETLVAEATRQAARIAAKLDRLLTPHSRAAAGGGGPQPEASLLEAAAAAAAEEEEEEEVPLRRRYSGSGTPAGPGSHMGAW